LVSFIFSNFAVHSSASTPHGFILQLKRILGTFFPNLISSSLVLCQALRCGQFESSKSRALQELCEEELKNEWPPK
jgi:hypothetical protein